MLLRRITQHVKDQNWFAVALDFVIVVVGVFIGIQVANWNAARSDARAERLLLERLHDEITETQALDAATRTFFIDERKKNLISARHVILGMAERSELTSGECQAIGFSHLPLFGGSSNIPILSELRATGEISLIRNENVAGEVSKLTSLIETGSVFEESSRIRITLLSRTFPELLSIGLKKEATTLSSFEVDPYDTFYTCDALGMRASAAFRNAFGENVTQQFSLLEIAVDPIRQSLSDLHKALDKALGEAHDHK